MTQHTQEALSSLNHEAAQALAITERARHASHERHKLEMKEVQSKLQELQLTQQQESLRKEEEAAAATAALHKEIAEQRAKAQ